MKKLLSFSLIAICLPLFSSTGVHDFTVPKIEGGSQSLSAYQGKRILVITLPLVQHPAADSLLYSLDTLSAAHSSTLKVIAVPAMEDGYTATQKTALQQWYRSKLGNHILITEGLYTRKTSGTQQHPLFKWLTSDIQNDAFDIDVDGPGYKFFADEEGELFGVLRPHSTMWGQSVQRTLQLQ